MRVMRWQQARKSYRKVAGSCSGSCPKHRKLLAVRPSCGEILRRMCGECSLGFGLALWRFLERRELNTMLQPSTVHLCISRRCTAEKWILRAPLSQKVLKQIEHWTRFFPVDGLMNWPARLMGGEPQRFSFEIPPETEPDPVDPPGELAGEEALPFALVCWTWGCACGCGPWASR